MSWREVFPRAGYAALFFSAGDSGKIGRAPDAAACGPGGMRPVVVWRRDMVSLRRCCVRPSGPSL
ncbi:hypothetical protein DESPIG_02472 [Desulfovibrio piger ATCC 29098]|uniref:Uncharacterized protein n=1 Tax=Desulfovibrio piger ATCC 29098 TaxID=411464 RepID=B6WWK4_9BACT|nr:hypothetical protein DESPIG_02472 [Desulfovibrio piger ATCC 29098]